MIVPPQSEGPLLLRVKGFPRIQYGKQMAHVAADDGRLLV